MAKGPVVMQGIRSGKSVTADAVDAVKCIIVNGLRDLPPVTPKQPELSEEDRRLLKKLRSFHNGSYAKVIDRLMSAQPEQRTGEWEITDAYPHIVYCSECHKRFAQTHWAVWEDGSLPRNFCPNCGADMRGE